MAAPTALPPVGKCGQQTRGALALQARDEAPDRALRWDGDPHMPMIRRARPWEDIAPRLPTCLPDNGTHPFCHLTTQHFMAVLGDAG
jgi:hypothetical protein